jgi:hypothetical protein
VTKLQPLKFTDSVNNIEFRLQGDNAPQEIIRLDSKGFHYQGQLIEDAGEAHRLMVEFLKQSTQSQPEPTLPLEPRGCPTPGACSCPTAPTVPPDLIQALELAEAGLSDIGDADREPSDDLAWAEARAAQDLPRIRRTLNTWRDHSALAQPEPVAPTDEELLASVRHFYGDQAAADMGAEDDLRTARAVLARWGTPANNTREEN